ncbi:MAG: MBL fold metallo-hydrolase [Candidatus Kerfeldbacteria bacterium]|nr:MBL fold metallo-hydrolase [Candidatus Kerfeldbacteria bacterium]
MIIQWYGQACLRVQTKPGPNGEVTVLFDPYDPKIGLKLPKLTAEVVAVTHDHYDHNYLQAVGGDYFLIKGPGEYEVKQTFIYGIPGWHDSAGGSERGAVTMYLLQAEGMSFAHLGDLGQTQLTDEQLEQLEGVDVLALPVGGVYTINAKQAAAIVAQVEPRIVIPIHYHLPGLKVGATLEPVEKFVRELGLAPQTEDKFKFAKKDLPQEETKLVILRPQA